MKENEEQSTADGVWDRLNVNEPSELLYLIWKVTVSEAQWRNGLTRQVLGAVSSLFIDRFLPGGEAP